MERPMVAVRNIAAAVATSTVMVPPNSYGKTSTGHYWRRRPVYLATGLERASLGSLLHLNASDVGGTRMRQR